MKGYRKELEKFIEYVIEKYGNDNYVSGFRNLYNERKKELEANASKRKAERVSVSVETASVCQKLVLAEIERVKIIDIYPKGYLEKLQFAKKELSGEHRTEYVKKLLARIKDGN